MFWHLCFQQTHGLSPCLPLKMMFCCALHLECLSPLSTWKKITYPSEQGKMFLIHSRKMFLCDFIVFSTIIYFNYNVYLFYFILPHFCHWVERYSRARCKAYLSLLSHSLVRCIDFLHSGDLGLWMKKYVLNITSECFSSEKYKLF